MRSSVIRAGTMVPALAVFLSLAPVPPAGAGPLTGPAATVLQDLRQAPADAPVLPDAVDLALFSFSRTGDPADRTLAESLARRAAGAGEGMAGAGGLFAVADAGGATGAEAEAKLELSRTLLTASPQRATTDSFARLVEDFFQRAAFLGTEDAYLEAIAGAGALFTVRVRQGDRTVQVLPGGSEAPRAGLSDHLECLNVAVINAGATGSPVSLEFARRLGHDLLRQHWDDATARFSSEAWERTGLPPALDLLLNARAALALWRAGHLTGEALFVGRGERVLNAILEEALADPVSAPAAALASAILGEGGVVVAVVGDPSLNEMIRLRQDAMSLFYPGKIVVPIDPALDPQRMETLGCPPDADRATVVCVAGTCSPPLATLAEMEEFLARRVPAPER